MKKMKLLRSLFLCATILIASIAAVQAGSMTLLGAGSSGGGGGGACVPGTHASTFLARTSGLSGTETAAYCVLINGLDTDGTYALLDALYIFATNTTTTANLNLVSTSFGLTQTGTVTFAADVGYTGDFATGFLNTGLTPPGTHYTQNSSSIGAYVLNSRTSNDDSVEIGAGASPYAFIEPRAGVDFAWEINAATFPIAANTSTQGAWIVTRPSSTTENVYLNGSATAFGTASITSTGVPATTFTILALAGAANFSSDTVGAAFIGGGLTGAQSAAINNRINTYLTAFGVNVY